LPPFTPFTSTFEAPKDLDDLPEYTPFTDVESSSAADKPSINQPDSVEEVEEVVAVQSDFVQEMVVAAEAPGETVDYGEEQGEIVMEESVVKEEYNVVVPAEEVREEGKIEEEKVEIEEEKLQKTGKKPRNKKKKGGKGQIVELEPDTTHAQTYQLEKETYPPIITEELEVEQPQKPAEKTVNPSNLPKEEETKVVPDQPIPIMEEETVSAGKKVLQGSKNRQKARSGRPTAPSVEEPKVVVPENPKALIPEETKQPAIVPTRREEIEEDKPKQHILPAKGQQKLRSGKPPPGFAALSEETSQPYQPEESMPQAPIKAQKPPVPSQPTSTKETPQIVPAPATNRPAEESKKAVVLDNPSQKAPSSEPSTLPAPQEETVKTSEPTHRQPGLSAKARQRMRDVKQPETAPAKPEASPAKPEAAPIKHDTVPIKPEKASAKPEAVPIKPKIAPTKPEIAPAKPEAKPSPEAVQKAAVSKPANDPRLADLDKQVYLIKEKQRNAKLLTAKLHMSMEENQAKKDRMKHQIEKSKLTLARLNEELAKLSVSKEENKSEVQIKQLKVKVRFLTEDLEAKEADFAARRAAKEAQDKEIRDIRIKRKRLEEEKKAITKANFEAVSEAESYQSEIKRLEALIKQANETIQHMKTSSSSLDLETTLKSFTSKRTAKARDLGEHEGRVHASMALLESERQAYKPESAPGTAVGSSKLSKQIEEVDWELRSKTEEVERLRGEAGGVGCCPLIFLLLGLLLGVLVQRLVSY
jgi:hypothetical protein